MTLPTRRSIALLALLIAAVPARAQSTKEIDGPPRPTAPEVISRASNGQATVRAIKLTSPLKLDGRLDEDVYAQEKPFGGLIQVTPNFMELMTERSDVWIMYDAEYVYVTCKCWDSAPPSEWIANELRRDTNGLRQNDHFGVMFDTYYDRRSGFAFYTNPLGARADYSVVDEGGSNTDWNPVWTSATGRFEGGWIVEMAIPLKSIRYRAGKDQVWGVQLRRSVRRKNEWGYLTPVPQSLAGPQALNRISAAGTLVGLDLPVSGKNLELKPYGVSRMTTDRLRTPPVSNEVGSEFGGDMKYGITPNLTADFTYNTDFAQVEIDEQQVNLTRFSLFYPEKRDFFLEGRGIFDFARGGLGAIPPSNTDNLPYLFYTRRIGLNAGRVIPIDGGGRLTGKVGQYAVGLMNIQTGDEAVSLTRPTNFTVARVKRDIFKRSAIGVMATNRSLAASDSGSNQAYGVDGTFSFFDNVTTAVYWARTATDGRNGNDQSYQARYDYNADRYGARGDFLVVGKNFNPEVGFVRRTDFKRSFGELRFSPRPTNMPMVRKFTYSGNGELFVNGAGHVESRTWTGHFGTELANSDVISIDGLREYELLLKPFTPAGSPVAIAPGGYTFNQVGASYTLGGQRRIAGSLAAQTGEYYDGRISSVSFGLATNSFTSGGRISILPQLTMEPTVSLTRFDLPGGSYTARLFRTRADYGFSPLMFFSTLVQYNSADRAVSSFLRFRWEYRPGSELFLVYTDERDATEDRFVTPTTVRGLKNRAFVVKINRLLRY